MLCKLSHREAVYRKILINEDAKVVEELEDELAKKSFTTAAASNKIDQVWDLIDKVADSRIAAGQFDVDQDGFFSWEEHLTAIEDYGAAVIDDAEFDVQCATLSTTPGIQIRGGMRCLC